MMVWLGRGGQVVLAASAAIGGGVASALCLVAARQLVSGRPGSIVIDFNRRTLTADNLPIYRGIRPPQRLNQHAWLFENICSTSLVHSRLGGDWLKIATTDGHLYVHEYSDGFAELRAALEVITGTECAYRNSPSLLLAAAMIIAAGAICAAVLALGWTP